MSGSAEQKRGAVGPEGAASLLFLGVVALAAAYFLNLGPSLVTWGVASVGVVLVGRAAVSLKRRRKPETGVSYRVVDNGSVYSDMEWDFEKMRSNSPLINRPDFAPVVNWDAHADESVFIWRASKVPGAGRCDAYCVNLPGAIESLEWLCLPGVRRDPSNTTLFSVVAARGSRVRVWAAEQNGRCRVVVVRGRQASRARREVEGSLLRRVVESLTEPAMVEAGSTGALSGSLILPPSNAPEPDKDGADAEKKREEAARNEVRTRARQLTEVWQPDREYVMSRAIGVGALFTFGFGIPMMVSTDGPGLMVFAYLVPCGGVIGSLAYFLASRDEPDYWPIT